MKTLSRLVAPIRNATWAGRIGATTRDKVFTVDGSAADVAGRLAALRDGAP